MQGMVKDLKLPEESGNVIARRMLQQLSHLRTVWENKCAQLAALKGAVVPCIKVFEMQINLGDVVLRDRFEWYGWPYFLFLFCVVLRSLQRDIHNMQLTPEMFAKVLAVDMALPRHQEVLLAHAIRVKLFEFWEASLHEQLTPTRASQQQQHKGVSTVVRLGGEEWGPTLEQLQVAPPRTDDKREQAKEERMRRLKNRGKRRDREEEDELDDMDDMDVFDDDE